MKAYTVNPDKPDSPQAALGTIALVFAFMSYFIPREYAIGDTANNLWQLAAVIVSVVALIRYLATMRITLRWSMFMLFLFSYFMLSSMLAHSDGSLTRMLFIFIEVGGFVSLVEVEMTRSREVCLKAFLIAGVIMCGWHYITFLMYRYYEFGMKAELGGTYGELSRHPWFLLTHDNGSVFHFIPVVCCLWYSALEHRRLLLTSAIASILTLYMYWSLWSVTAMVVMTGAIALFFVLWLLDCNRLRSVLNYKRALTIGLLFCGGMLIINASDFLVSASQAFGKNTVDSRGYLWQIAISEFSKSPVFGLGFESDATIISKFGFNHCHNIIMQVLYTGGIVATTFFVMSLYLCDVPKEMRGNSISRGQAILCVAVFAILFAGTFDWDIHNAVQYFPFFMYPYSALCSDAPPDGLEGARGVERVLPGVPNVTSRLSKSSWRTIR